MDAAIFKELAKGYRHFCYVTDDIDKSLRFFAAIGAQGLDKHQTRGNAMVFALGDLGNGNEVEIIQPLEGGSTYADFLDRNGPGIHHVAFRVANFDEVYASLTALGCPVLQEGCGMFRGRMVNMAYIDCTAIGGPVIELGEITESGSHAGAEPGVMEG